MEVQGGGLASARGLVQEAVAAAPGSPRRHYGVSLADLVEAGYLRAGEVLRWERRRAGVVHAAVVLPGGVGLEMDGKEYSSVSGPADAASGTSNDGWMKWTVEREGSWVTLHDIRAKFLHAPDWPQHRGRFDRWP